MKILLIGGTGTLGTTVAKRLESDHELISVGHTSGDLQTDISDPEAIKNLFEEVGKVDAVVVTTGSAPMKPLKEMTNDDFLEGVESKMMGQINVALTAMDYLNKGGSITLTSGILSDDPIPQGTILSTVNSAVNGFVAGSNGEFNRQNIRINVVSPGLVEDSAEALGDYFPGHHPVAMERVATAYEKSVLGLVSGEIIKVW
ncbi:MAG: short chain dehydrogenase [Balneolaceae bacterium]|nr:short chain dehydrogenase [Balneolaceae bacterium]